VAPECAALDPRGLRLRIHADRVHLPHVDADPAVANGVSGDAVATAVDRQRQRALAREVHRGANVVGALASREHRGAPIDTSVEDPAQRIEALVAVDDQFPCEALPKGGYVPEIPP